MTDPNHPRRSLFAVWRWPPVVWGFVLIIWFILAISEDGVLTRACHYLGLAVPW